MRILGRAFFTYLVPVLLFGCVSVNSVPILIRSTIEVSDTEFEEQLDRGPLISSGWNMPPDSDNPLYGTYALRGTGITSAVQSITCQYYVFIDKRGVMSGTEFKGSDSGCFGLVKADSRRLIRLEQTLLDIPNRYLEVSPSQKRGQPVEGIAYLTLRAEGKNRDRYSFIADHIEVSVINFEPLDFTHSSGEVLDGYELPSTDLSESDIRQIISGRLVKGEYESTDEFEQRKRVAEREARNVAIYAPVGGMRYDADSEIFNLISRCSFDEETRRLQSDTKITSHTGVNGFGARWSWSEQTGTRTELRWPCEIYKAAGLFVSRELAPQIGRNLVVIAEVSVAAQTHESDRDFQPAEFGRSLASNVYIDVYRGEITKLYIGDRGTGAVYGVLNLGESQ